MRILRCSVAAVRHVIHRSDGRLHLRALHPRRRRSDDVRIPRPGADSRGIVSASRFSPSSITPTGPPPDDEDAKPASAVIDVFITAWGSQRRRRSRCRTSQRATTWAIARREIQAALGVIAVADHDDFVERVKFLNDHEAVLWWTRHARRPAGAPSSWKGASLSGRPRLEDDARDVVRDTSRSPVCSARRSRRPPDEPAA